MRKFSYVRAASADGAVAAFGKARASIGESPVPAIAYLGGGTTLVDLMKLEVMRPQVLVDLGDLRARLGAVEASARGLRLGAFTTMASVAEHPRVASDYPVIAQSLRQAASQQLRNMATLGGNVLQRTRCPYFRDIEQTACNKRQPGSGCAAIGGVHRGHAILGTSEQCIATYPGDLAQALVALDATVQVQGPRGRRQFPFASLHVLPGATPNIETTLHPGELIVGFDVPAGPWTRRSAYVKVRDRASYEFALASAAVALDLSEGRVREARIALGGVATVPWRARPAEAMLIGKPLTAETAEVAAREALKQAWPRHDNAYKVDLARRTITRALLQAAQMEVSA